MKFKKKQKKIFKVLLSFGILFCCAVSFFMPQNFAMAESLNCDYDAFSKALRVMISENEASEKSEVFSFEQEDYIEQDDEILLLRSSLSGTALVEEDIQEEYVSLKKIQDVSAKVKNQTLVLETKPQINRLIVKSDKKVKACGAVAAAEYKEYHIFQYANKESAAEAYEYYSANDDIFSVEYDYLVEADAEIDANATTYYSWGWKASDDLLGANAYIQDMMSNFNVSDLNSTVVAVLDSGINTSHSLFQGRILHQYAKNFTNEKSTTSYAYEDLNGHGSHVSGTIAEITMSNVQILPLKVLKADGKGYVSWIVDAIEYCQTLKTNKNLNIKTVNMSIGVDASSNANGVSAQSVTLTNAVKSAYSNYGILSVVSAGNESKNTLYSNPANVDCAITVSALKKVDYLGSQKMYFDSGYSNFGSHVDFAAPGSAVRSAARADYGSEYCTMSGTSMAAPHVTAIVALIYSNPNYANYSFEELNTMLRQNATDLGDEGWDEYYGYGAINISKLGLVNNGEVEFSVTEKMQTNPFALQLTYQTTLAEGQTQKIYYSLDETITSIQPVVSSTTALYNSPITISKTTKVTAVGFVYDASGAVVKRSHTSSMVYYFDNLDLLSNYEFETYSYGKTIVEYKGELTTLKVPSVINYVKVAEVGSFAFNNSNVEVLYLPNTITKIATSAFNGNSKLKELYCESGAVEIGSYAFRWCSNLKTFELAGASTVGEYAFANCASLDTLLLPYATTVGKHSLSESAVQTLMFGPYVENIGYQTKTKLQKVYGYKETCVEDFVSGQTAEFVDLSLKFLNDLPSRKVVKETSTLPLSVSYFGFGTDYLLTFSGSKDQVEGIVKHLPNFEVEIDFELSNLEAGEVYDLYFSISDFFGNEILGKTLSVEVVEASRKEHVLNFTSGNYKILIDGQEVSAETGEIVLYEDVSYEFEIEADDGYNLDYLEIDGNSYSVGNPIQIVVEDDVDFDVTTSEQQNLQITFDCKSGGAVYVDSREVVACQVERGKALEFQIVELVGYEVKSVKVDGVECSISEDGNYVIENVTTDKTVEIEFEQKTYTVSISLGKGGSISPAELSSQVARGASKAIKISAYDGYAIDYISVNGVIVEKDINSSGFTFELKDVNENCAVYISLKKEVEILGSEYSNIVKYFIVFVGIFVVFVVARILLHYAKKEKNKIETNKYKK